MLKFRLYAGRQETQWSVFESEKENQRNAEENCIIPNKKNENLRAGKGNKKPSKLKAQNSYCKNSQLPN